MEANQDESEAGHINLALSLIDLVSLSIFLIGALLGIRGRLLVLLEDGSEK